MVGVCEALATVITGPFSTRNPLTAFPLPSPPNWRKEKLGGFSI